MKRRQWRGHERDGKVENEKQKKKNKTKQKNKNVEDELRKAEWRERAEWNNNNNNNNDNPPSSCDGAIISLVAYNNPCHIQTQTNPIPYHKTNGKKCVFFVVVRYINILDLHKLIQI